MSDGNDIAPGLMVLHGNRLERIGGAPELGETAAEAHGRIFRPEPAGQVARFVSLEFIPFRVGIEQDEAR